MQANNISNAVSSLSAIGNLVFDELKDTTSYRDWKSTEAYTKNPAGSILQIKENKGNYEINVMSKGIWTWIKIHIGSALGLFDKSSIKMSNVAAYVFNELNLPVLDKTNFLQEILVNVGVPNANKFLDAFNAKLSKWEAKHFEAVKGPLTLKVNASEVKHLLIDPKEKPQGIDSETIIVLDGKPLTFASDSELSKKIIAAFPKNCGLQVGVNRFKDNRVVTVHMSQLSTLLKSTDPVNKKAVDQEALLKTLLKTKKFTSNPFEQVQQQGYQTVRVTLTNDPAQERGFFEKMFSEAPEATVSAKIEILGHR